MPVGTQATRTEGLRLDIWGQAAEPVVLGEASVP